MSTTRTDPASDSAGLFAGKSAEWIADYYEATDREQNLRDAIEHAADDLLRLSRELRWASGNPHTDALRWLGEAATRGGYISAPADQRPVRRSGQIRDEKAQPTTRHRRLHDLADRDVGWQCRDCHIGLVDICQDDDVVTDEDGRRSIRPGCEKRLPTEDHVIPRQQNGANRLENLALVCGPCNIRKGAA